MPRFPKVLNKWLRDKDQKLSDKKKKASEGLVCHTIM